MKHVKLLQNCFSHLCITNIGSINAALMLIKMLVCKKFKFKGMHLRCILPIKCKIWFHKVVQRHYSCKMANIFRTIYTNFYQNWPDFVEDMTKDFGVFSVHSVEHDTHWLLAL